MSKEEKKERREIFKRLHLVDKILILIAITVPQVYSYLFLPTFIFAPGENIDKLYYAMVVWIVSYAIAFFVLYKRVLPLGDISDRLVSQFIWEYTAVFAIGQIIALIISLPWGDLISALVALFIYLIIMYVLPFLVIGIIMYFVIRKVFRSLFNK